jgi:hypothetical protein
MTSQYFIQWSIEDQDHPMLVYQSVLPSSTQLNSNIIYFIDANTYIEQSSDQKNSFIRYPVSLNIFSNNYFTNELQTRNTYYPILQNLYTLPFTYYIPYIFYLSVGQEKAYYYQKIVSQPSWNWSSNPTNSDLFLIYNQKYCIESSIGPLEKKWTLVRILYNINSSSSYLLKDLSTNAPIVKELFKQNYSIAGSKIIDICIATSFLKNYDVFPNQSLQTVFPI